MQATNQSSGFNSITLETDTYVGK